MMPTRILILATCALSLGGCGAVGRLKMVGKAPPLSTVDTSNMPEIEDSLGQSGAARFDPRPRTAAAGAAPAREAPAPAAPAPTASLFRAGAGAFLADQRAGRVGDILTIRINIADKADLGDTTTRSRKGDETAGLTSLLGLENPIQKLLRTDPSKAVGVNSKSDNSGTGTISRSETINMTMSAIVTNVLPNGNLVIRGRQEVRVNFELRELIVTGIVRPQDIARDNSIQHSQIAEARISYGGKGQLTEAQQARWGQQIYDALFPF